MQIFATSADPEECARVLSDRQVIKMVTETAQLLSAAVRHTGRDLLADDWDLYKRPPSGAELVAWAAERANHFDWLVRHGRALVDECRWRGLGVPTSGEVLTAVACNVSRAIFPGFWPGELAKPPARFVNRARNLVAGLDFTGMTDVHEAYRLYLTLRWSKGDWTWTRREPPGWFWNLSDGPPKIATEDPVEWRSGLLTVRGGAS
jgi:hypothetical protein